MDNKKTSAPLKNQRGAVIITVAICLVILIGFAALAIDVGYLYTTRNELQNVADAAALAGARYMGEVYAGLSPSEMGSHPFTHEEIYAVVQAVATQNKAGSKNISIDSADVLIGLWNPEISDDDIWNPTLTGPDAVRVIARRDNTANTPINTFLAGVLGVDLNTLNVTSEKAVAALTGPAYVDEGELKTPFGLSENNFPNDCKDVISFSPTTDSCAGWHNFFDPMNASSLDEKLIGLIQGHTDCEHCGTSLLKGPEWLDANFDINKTPDAEQTPVTSTGDAFNFKGGTISSLFLGGYLGNDYNGNTGTVYGDEKHPASMIALFDYFRYRDGDGDDSIWTTTVPVYKDEAECTNPNSALELVGFATIEIKSPDPPPLSNLQVNVYCDLTVIDGRGGGGTYGNLKGTIPNLVK